MKEVTRPLEWNLPLDSAFRRAGIRGITIQREETDRSCCSGRAAVLAAFCGVFCKDNPGVVLDGVEICMGAEQRPKSESRKVFLLGNCAIAANRDSGNAIGIKGCPPPILDTVMSITLKCLPPARVARILASRTIKNLGMKLGVYDESFPAYGAHTPPEFDRSHF